MGHHDAFFKRVFADPARASGMVRAALPAGTTRALDLGAMELMSESFVDAALAERHADLLFRTTIRSTLPHDQTDAPSAAYVYLLLEHQSEADPMMPVRVLQYMLRIWERHQAEAGASTRLPPIFPLIVHHGERGWTSPRHFHEVIAGLEQLPGLRKHVPAFALAIADLVTHGDDFLATRRLDTLARLALLLLRDTRAPDRFLRHVGAWRELLVLLGRRQDREEFRVVMRYLSRVLTKPDMGHVIAQVVDLAPSLESDMISFADHHEQIGMEKGRVEAKRDTLRRMLSSKFGTTTAEVLARVDGAAEAELDQFLDRILHAITPDDVVRDV